MKITLRSILAAGTILSGAETAQAQNFGNAYFFGDSLTDCCNIGRTTNSQTPNWADQLPPAIGASFVASTSTNYAVSGAQSGQKNVLPFLDVQYGSPSGFTPQVGRFTANNFSISARDIVGVWIGTNDIWSSAQSNTSAVQPLGARPPVATLTDYIVGNVRKGLNTLVNQGFRNVVLVSPYDLSQSTIFSLFGSSDSDTRALASQYSEAYRNALANLYTPGVNTYFLDTLTLLRRVQASPAVYGFSSVTADQNCSATPSCANASVADQNRYVFNDTIHTTNSFDRLMVAYIANSINARSSLPAQGDLGHAVGTGFSGTLLNRLDAYRDQNTPLRVPSTYTADLPSRTTGPSAIPDMIGNPFSLFAEGSYASIGRSARFTPTAPNNPRLDADFAGVTAGAEYRVSPSLLIGAAFNYFNTSVDLRGSSNARLDLDSYQGGVFASYNQRNLFVDGALTYGSNNYDLSRPGVLDTLTATPLGNTFTTAGKIGYLFDYGTFRIGPIAELTYANVRIGSYNERGDSLLTLGVRQQNFDGLTGGAGAQFRATLPVFGGQVGAFINLTAQHDFLGGVRSITSFSTDAPALLINTQAGRRTDELYGKLAGGVQMDLGHGLSGLLTGSATFGRTYGDDYLVSIGLRQQF